MRELSFSTSLKPILTDDLATHLGIERISEFLNNYWEAWRQSRRKPSRSQRTRHPEDPGIFSLHLVAKYVLRLFDYRKIASPSVDEIRIVLEDAGEAASSEYWRSGNTDGAALAGSMAGFKMLADTIIEVMQDNGQTI